MDQVEHNSPMVRPTKGCSYVARVAFDHGDRRFEIGDHYPYAELEKHELDAYNMWRAGLLSVATVTPPAQPKPTGRAARR